MPRRGRNDPCVRGRVIVSEWHDQADLIPIDGWAADKAVNLSDDGVHPFVHLSLRIQPPDDTDPDDDVRVMELALSFDTASRMALDLLTITIGS